MIRILLIPVVAKNIHLSGWIQYVSTREELDLQLRDNYFNVYYNGGNALRVTPTGLFLDPWYFYTGEYNGVKIPKTYIEEQCKNKPRHKQPRNYPSKELAQEIYGWMTSKAATILEKAEKGDFKAYFEELKTVMDIWSRCITKRNVRDSI
jgi:hypothetical protein